MTRASRTRRMLRNSIFGAITTKESQGPVSKTGRKLLRMTIRARLFAGVPQEYVEMAFRGSVPNAAGKRSSITIRGRDAQRASLARRTKIPRISAPWRRYCISDRFLSLFLFPRLSLLTSPLFFLTLLLEPPSLSLQLRGHMQGDVYWIFMTYMPPKWVNLRIWKVVVSVPWVFGVMGGGGGGVCFLSL